MEICQYSFAPLAWVFAKVGFGIWTFGLPTGKSLIDALYTEQNVQRVRGGVGGSTVTYLVVASHPPVK